MGRVWDILPPHQTTRSTKSPSVKRKTKNASVFFVLMIIIFVGIFIFTAVKNTPTTNIISDLQKTPDPKLSELVPTQKNTDQLLIKVLNGTGRSEETASIVSILNEIGFKVAKTENALSLYDQTTIYFEPNQEKYAQEIAQKLTRYKVKTQQFSQDSPYDLIIVIGAK